MTDHKPVSHLALLAENSAKARDRAKALTKQVRGLRNIESPAAIEVADDLQALANDYELLANGLRYQVKLAADARFRA